MSDFMTCLSSEIEEQTNVSYTENGAKGYRTTGSKLLDLNFAISSLRDMAESTVRKRARAAMVEDPKTFIAWAFYLRDVRGGAGERRSFRAILPMLAVTEPDLLRRVLPLVPVYGRWDDLFVLRGTELWDDAVDLIRCTLQDDLKAASYGKSVSLLAKWMPSENASSPATRKLAYELIQRLEMKPKGYRKMMTYLRNRIKLVETKMSSGLWGEIDYEAVPSRANMVYRKAFLRHDEDRRREFLSKVEKGEKKVNAGTLYPHEIVHRYDRGYSGVDSDLESMWNNLPDYTEGKLGETLVVSDGSGSMEWSGLCGNLRPIEIAHALAIYFSERLKGAFKDKYIVFSSRPSMMDLSGAKTLRDKVAKAFSNDDCSNTDIEKTFMLVLDTAVRYGMKQEDMPRQVLIISDMEFDNAHTYGQRVDATLFDTIAQRFADHGYQLPKLVFWNVCGRTNTIPVKENDAGVVLLSGFSPACVKMALSGNLDPLECMMDVLHSERYAMVWERLNEASSEVA